MKYDKQKINTINNTIVPRIRAVKQQLSFDPDLPLYASYLYASVAHARRHIHMKHWNKHVPAQDQCDFVKLEDRLKSGWGFSGLGVEIKTLEDQEKFLGFVKVYLEKHQKYNGNLNGLPVEFPTLQVAPAESSPPYVAP